MDENSREETSKGAENVEDGQKAKKTENAHELKNMEVRIVVGGKINKNMVSDRCGSSYDASGPSANFLIFKSHDMENAQPSSVNRGTEPSITKTENEVTSTEPIQPLPPVVINEQPTKKPLIQVVIDDQPTLQPLKFVTIDEQINQQPLKIVTIDEQPSQQSLKIVTTGELSAPEPSAPVVINEDQMQHSVPPQESCSATCILPGYEDREDFQTRVRLAPGKKEHLTTKKASIGPPPSYSFVMKQKKKQKTVPSPNPLVTDRPPPPSYTGTRGLFLTPEESRLERICNLPSFVEPVWRSHSQPALCPRCGVIVLTTTHSHDSVATHVAALALCLFGCWPCCLLPYCINACKNTYHHCPICQAFLGLYTPW